VVRPLLLSLLVACGGGDESGQPGTTPAPEAKIPELTGPVLLSRISLDLRGVRPTEDEIARVEADPAAVDALVDEFLQDPRFEQRVIDLFAEVYLTRTENYLVDFSGVELLYPTDDLLRSIGEEPLRIVAHAAMNDLPATDIVTGDWTMADEILASIYPLDYPAGETGWRVAHYTDGRPAAGVLATNGMWWRYQSSDSNANRKRANATSRILLCHDYLTRPIEFDRNVNLLDEAALSDALKTNPGCMNCHSSLDPLAAYFYGFWWYGFTIGEMSEYHPSREQGWEDMLGVSPAYYGDPGSSLADLGWQIAGDNRFPECLAQRVSEGLLRRDATLGDFDRLVEHREALIGSGMQLRALFRSVVSSPEYRAAAAADLPAEAVPLKLTTPLLLASEVEDITGFDWQYMGWDMLGSDQVGFLTLAGGADGVFTTRNASTTNPTLLLVQERLAEAAASYAVATDAADPAHARLFRRVDFTETPETGRDAMVAQLQDLHLRIFGTRVAADGEQVAANLGLWSDLYAVSGDPATAWTGVLSALLRDPDFVLY
jgi:hypothetical protein